MFGPGPDRRNAEVFATGKALPFYEVTYPDNRGGSIILWSTKVPLLDEWRQRHAHAYVQPGHHAAQARAGGARAPAPGALPERAPERARHPGGRYLARAPQSAVGGRGAVQTARSRACRRRTAGAADRDRARGRALRGDRPRFPGSIEGRTAHDRVLRSGADRRLRARSERARAPGGESRAEHRALVPARHDRGRSPAALPGRVKPPVERECGDAGEHGAEGARHSAPARGTPETRWS